MNKFIWCLPTICGLLLSAFPQVRDGSVGVVYYSDDKLVMAADSRGTTTDGIVPTNTECKVAAFNNKLVFVSTGAVEYGRNERIRIIPDIVQPWSNVDEARNAFSSATLTSNLVYNTALRWGNAVAGHWNFLHLFNPDKVRAAVARNGALTGSLTVALFGGIDGDGRLRLVETTVDFNDFALVPITATTKPVSCIQSWCAIGAIEIVLDFLNQTSDQAKQEMIQWGRQQWPAGDAELLKAIRLVDLTIAYHIGDDVGPPIDALELRRDGSFRWFARKDNCPAD